MKSSQSTLPHIGADGFQWPEAARPQREIRPNEVELAFAFLKQCTPTKTKGIGSYGLKHTIESAVGSYISNGACIQAALQLGLKVIPAHRGYSLLYAHGTKPFYEPHPVNAWICISRKSIRHARQAFTPNVLGLSS